MSDDSRKRKPPKVKRKPCTPAIRERICRALNVPALLFLKHPTLVDPAELSAIRQPEWAAAVVVQCHDDTRGPSGSRISTLCRASFHWYHPQRLLRTLAIGSGRYMILAAQCRGHW